MPFVGIPSRETITCVGCRREGATPLVAGGTQHPAVRRFRVQSTRRRNRTAAGRYDVERIGKAVLETAAALVSVAVAHTHFISEPCASFGDDLRVIDQFVIVRSLLVIEREIVAGIALIVIDEERPVGRGQQLQLARKCRLALRTFDIHVKRSVERKYAIVADAVALEIVGHAQRIAVYAGVHLIVARDRDVERMGRITPYVEVRRTVLTQVNAVVEDAAAPVARIIRYEAHEGALSAFLSCWSVIEGTVPCGFSKSIARPNSCAARRREAPRAEHR